MASCIASSLVAPVQQAFHRSCNNASDKCSSRYHLSRANANGSSSADPPTSTADDSEKEELATKLAAAEAEAEALRKELSARRAAAGKDVDISKLKPATPEKRIDGTGFRETILPLQAKPKTGTGSSRQQQFNRWSLSETELFLSKGAPTEGTGLGVPALEDGSDELVRRRLVLGCGLALVAVGAALIRFPTERPSKPLFFYVTSILRLQEQLQFIENSSSDAQFVRDQLKRVSASPDVLKDEFLSAAAWLDGADADRATSLAFSVFDYLNQADYRNYFDNLGEPTVAQQSEFLKFGIESIKAARRVIDEFVQILPPESVEAARSQVLRGGSGLG